MYGDMNGIGPEEVVVIAARTSPGAFEMAQPYVDIYSYSEGDWQRVEVRVRGSTRHAGRRARHPLPLPGVRTRSVVRGSTRGDHPRLRECSGMSLELLGKVVDQTVDSTSCFESHATER